MAIWEYRGVADNEHINLHPDFCLFCKSEMVVLHNMQQEDSDGAYTSSKTEHLRVCSCCGWWVAGCSNSTWPMPSKELKQGERSYGGAIGALRTFDPADVTAPVEEVRSYLLARYDKRHAVDARLFEEVVASVFGDLGYSTVVTAYSGDGGVDVILNDGSSEIGVQVKRYKNSIKVNQIRELIGALYVGGYTKGVFVTTSSFQRGGAGLVKQAAELGISVELLDAQSFYRDLRIAQRPLYGSLAEFREVVDLSFSKLPTYNSVVAF